MKASRVLLILLVMLGARRTAAADDSMGHSRHGSAFDTGLRQKPWHMDGIGKAPPPLDTKRA